jgi:hypothetical protein
MKDPPLNIKVQITVIRSAAAAGSATTVGAEWICEETFQRWLEVRPPACVYMHVSVQASPGGPGDGVQFMGQRKVEQKIEVSEQSM